MKDSSKEVNELLQKYNEKGFEYGKPIQYIEFRNKCSREEIEKEILQIKGIKFTEKQVKDGEVRYKLYFVYSNTRGRAYVLTFREKIRIITIYPLGRRTLKYLKI